MTENNNRVVLVVGKPASGKSASLHKAKDDEGIAYINCDLKDLPFRAKFPQMKITNPLSINNIIDKIEKNDKIHTGVLDTMTFLMDMYESQFVVGAKDTRGAWLHYAEFYKKFIKDIKSGKKNYIIFAHVKNIYNEKELVTETSVSIKGQIGERGPEADFTTVIGCKKIDINKLEEENDLLEITEKEKKLGFKYVFQTFVDADSINDKMRSHMGLWNDNEKYIDNDILLVTKRLSDYYS